MPNIPPKPDTDDKPLLTLAEAALLGSLSVSALRKRCQRGEAGYKIGKTWVLSREEAYRLQEEGHRPAGRPLRPIASRDDPPK